MDPYFIHYLRGGGYEKLRFEVGAEKIVRQERPPIINLATSLKDR